MPKQTRETNIEGGEDRQATHVLMNRLTGLSLSCVFKKTSINYDQDRRCGIREIWISINPPPLFSPVIMNQVGLVTKLTVNNTLMLNSQQCWSSIVNHNGVCPSGHGQGIV